MHERMQHERPLQKVARYLGSKCAVILVLGALLTPVHLGKEDFFKLDMGNHCLATAVYYEARGEPLTGQRAVVDVIIHRAYKSGKTFCEVLTQKQQFQWTKRNDMRYDVDHLLEQALKQPTVLKDENFLFFHSTKIRPVWSKKMECRRIGNHNFCKEIHGHSKF